MENIIKGIRRYYPVKIRQLTGNAFSPHEKAGIAKETLTDTRRSIKIVTSYFIEKGFCRSYCLRDGERNY